MVDSAEGKTLEQWIYLLLSNHYLEMNLSAEKQSLLNLITHELKQIAGIKAIVLGGSHAAGMATERSDFDIGIYYSEKELPDLPKIKIIAENISAVEPPVVTGFYEWGPWVNGGAWINTEAGKVDFLYKNIEQISRTIENAKKGIWENNFEQQPPYGFSSIIFLGETNICIPLYDPENIIAALKEKVKEYPLKLKQAVIQQSLWSAEFTIWQAQSFVAKMDNYNSMGCFTRAIKNIVTTLFAINELYPLGDKRAIDILEQSKRRPSDLKGKIDHSLSTGGNDMAIKLTSLKMLFTEVVELAGEHYKPYYTLH